MKSKELKFKRQDRKNRGITLIALVVTIVVLLILAAVSIAMLGGENGIMTQTQDAKEQTDIASEKEKVELAAVTATEKDTWGNITKDNLKEELDKNIGEGKYTLEGEGPFTVTYVDSGRSYIVDANGKVIQESIYNADVSEEDIAPTDIFKYEIISDAETGATSLDSLPTKEARITGIKEKYCNCGGYTSETGEKYESTNYEIVLDDGSKITDTLVVPYQVEIDGEMYKITEANITAYWVAGNGKGYTLPTVRKIIYPNTIKTISGAINDANDNIGANNNGIEEIILPQNLEILGTAAFYNCNSLKNIEIPSSVTSIGYSAFEGCSSLTSIEIPSSVTSIGNRAFQWCRSLTSIEIPSSVTSIGSSAFYYCSSLTNIEIPSSVTSIGSFAFDGTQWYNSLSNGEVYIGKVFYKYKGQMPENTSIQIKDGTTSIGGSAFQYCSRLTSIEIPNSVTSIGYSAFEGCSSLTSIEIPNSVTSIGSYAFYNCSSLTTVNYTGTMEQWRQISIGTYGNDDLKNATIICTDGTLNP